MFEQLLAHLWGDYLLQSDWMAENKTKRWLPAAIHATVYSLAFLLFRPSLLAFAVILGTHYLIDRYRLARYVVWGKNWLLAPRWLWAEYTTGSLGWQLYTGGFEGEDHGPIYRGGTMPFRECAATGYMPSRPIWLAVWLLIIADNILHLTINYAALRWL
jgi:hypothetical protein